MALIGTGVYGNAVSSKPLAVKRNLDYVRVVAASCVTYGSYLVDINT
jgi:hypothetical protein